MKVLIQIHGLRIKEEITRYETQRLSDIHPVFESHSLKAKLISASCLQAPLFSVLAPLVKLRLTHVFMFIQNTFFQYRP